jgi:V8-like Glu-specific endopeptidase
MNRFFLVFLAGLSSVSAFAMPLGKTMPLDFFRAPARMNIAELGDVNFEGIVALSNCSGAIVRYESSIDDDQAMVLTNGHCFEGGFAEPGAFFFNVESNRKFAVLEPSSGRSLGLINAEKVLYATMTKTDVTLYRVVETFRQIKAKYGVRPLTLSSRQAPVGQKIDIVSGYWKRGYSCSIEYFVDTLKEDRWTMRNSIRYSRPGCETIGGTSGSPIIASGTDKVIGINNTGNESGRKCTMNNPCEVSKDGTVIAQKGVSYGQQIALFYSCLDSQLRLDLKIPTCQLPGGASAGMRAFRLRSR